MFIIANLNLFKSYSEIKDLILKKFEVDEFQCDKDLNNFLENLNDRSLLVFEN